MYVPAYQLTDGMAIISPTNRRWVVTQLAISSAMVIATINDSVQFMFQPNDLVMVDASSILVSTGGL